MSLLDIRQDPIILALSRLDHERKEEEKKKILKDIQNLILNQTNEQIFLSLKRYLNLKNDTENKLEKQVKAQIAHFKIMNSSLTVKDCEALLKILNEQKNSAFKKDIEYTKYLIACDEYKQKTGNHPTHDKVQSVDTKDKVKVEPVETHTHDTHNAPKERRPETEKSPIFIDKNDYKDGSVTIYRGVKPGDLEKISEEIVSELNKKKPGSAEFKKTDRGFIVTYGEDVYDEYKKLETEKINKIYQVFSHSSEKKEKAIPEKYHFSSETEQKDNTKKLAL